MNAKLAICKECNSYTNISLDDLLEIKRNGLPILCEDCYQEQEFDYRWEWL